MLATAFSSPGQQQNVNEDALNEPALAALSLLAGRANMFPVWRKATALWANYVPRFRMDQHVPFAFRHEVVRGEWRTLLMLWVRKETKTNKSFVFSYLLHFPPHPNPLPFVFCVHSCVICSSILSSLLSHTSSTTILSPPLMPVSPRLLSSPITPTGPACLPTAVRGVSLKAAALGL